MGQFSGFQETLPQALKALDKFNNDEDPFFLFVHGYDCHTPYVKPGLLARIETPNYDGPMLDVAWQPLTYERILNGTFYPDFRPPHFTDAQGNDFLDPTTFDSLERFASIPDVRAQELTSEDIAFLLGAYDASVRSADFFVGVLLNQLAQTGLDENTAVIIMSDHGEDLLDHGHFNHRLGLEDEHVNVVLMARVPGVNPKRSSEPVALLDVNATIRSLAGIPAPTRGQSLLGPESSERAVYSESMLGDVAMRGNDFTLIVPRELASGPLPEAAPDDAQFLDNAGAALPWSGPGLQSLWTRLVAEVPK